MLNVLITTTYDTKHFTALNLIFIWGNWLLYIIATILANMIPMLSFCRRMFLVAWRSYSNPVHWVIVLTATSISVVPVLVIQSVFAILLPSRAQQLRDAEIAKQSRFEPIYVINLEDDDEVNEIDDLYDESKHVTVWDTSHHIWKPLVTCCRRAASKIVYRVDV
jgi:phospholipid-translocating ATPase